MATKASSTSSESYSIRVPKLSLKNTSYIPVLMVLLLVASFFLGRLTSQVEYLKKGATTETVGQAVPQAAPQQPQAPTITLDAIKALFTDTNIHFGDKNSKNLIVEVADPSCPWCHVAAGQNPELSAQMGKQLSTDGGTYVAAVPEMKKLVDSGEAGFVWIYTNGHGSGEMGTKALYCAHEKGKFWPVHDKLMTNEGYNLLNNQVKNDKTQSQQLATFLSDVFNASDMKNCLDSGKYDKKLTEDIATARSLGINGTPGFYINTTNFSGAYPWEEIKSAIK